MKKLALVCTFIWIGVVCTGVGLLNQYAFTAGESARAPAHWPDSSRWPASAPALSSNQDRPTLLVFAHPNCSCTHATLAELSRLLAKLNGRVDARLILERHPGLQGEVGITQQALNIKDLEIIQDDGGHLAQTFGSKTSGQAMLFNTAGNLVFQGGLTSSRGHEGENAGTKSIAEIILHSRIPASIKTSVFGCKL